MTALNSGLFVVPIPLMLLLGLLPDRLANRTPRRWGSAVTLLLALALLAVLTAAGRVVVAGPIDVTFVRWNAPWPFCLGIRLDPLALFMSGLISFLGLIVARFSRTYLLGDSRQGTFFKWLSFTLGATLALVISWCSSLRDLCEPGM